MTDENLDILDKWVLVIFTIITLILVIIAPINDKKMRNEYRVRTEEGYFKMFIEHSYSVTGREKVCWRKVLLNEKEHTYLHLNLLCYDKEQCQEFGRMIKLDKKEIEEIECFPVEIIEHYYDENGNFYFRMLPIIE